MKIMVAADIHGSAYYCEKLLKKYKEEACDKLLLLGDILYHGPRNDLPEEYNPKKVLAMLNEMKNEILCVRGNCDTEVDPDGTGISGACGVLSALPGSYNYFCHTWS